MDEFGVYNGTGSENKIFKLDIYKIGFTVHLSYRNLNDFFLDIII